MRGSNRASFNAAFVFGGRETIHELLTGMPLLSKFIAAGAACLCYLRYKKVADGYAVSYLMRYKFQSGGMLPFIRYCFYKLADISNVRIILAGLINGEKSADIKDRLREHYAG